MTVAESPIDQRRRYSDCARRETVVTAGHADLFREEEAAAT
jgi:hypothetical protein